MKCPRTGTDLKEIVINGIKIDISEACGGVWLDNFELKKFDEIAESAGEELVSLMQKFRNDHLDFNQRLASPRHPEILMMRHFYSPKRQIEIDECPQSGGIWLDAGELYSIRKLFPSKEDRRKAGKEFVDEVIANSDFPAMIKENEERLQKARRIANFFRWLCPSYYIPGEQDWEVF